VLREAGYSELEIHALYDDNVVLTETA